MSPPERSREVRSLSAFAERWTNRRGAIVVLLICVLFAATAFALVISGAPHFKRLKKLIVATERSHPDVLWRVVHDGCVFDQSHLGHPAPCLEVNLAKGYAIIKDPERPTQLLLVPTERISGIESKALLATGTKNYWLDAWSARHWLELEFGAPIDQENLGLAVNSRLSRTQGQLHIHIDCVRPEVHAAIEAAASSLGPQWTTLSGSLIGSNYDALWIDADGLRRTDPFQVLARDARAGKDMGAYSLTLVGAKRRDGEVGFVLFRSHETAANYGAPTGERLLDHHCRILKGNGLRD